jgi:SHS2 domain-containing protein
MSYETFEHTADLGLRVRAADLNGLFVEAARGLFSIIVANLDQVRSQETIKFTIAGQAPDLLLFDWLSELIYTYETRRVVLAEFDVHVGPDGLTAIARGEPIDRATHKLDHEVKAVTYHGLKVERDAAGWLAEVIVDI